MIAKAIDKILQISAPALLEINGRSYTSKDVMRVNEELRAEPIACKTLTGVLDYITKNKDAAMNREYFLHVVNAKRVELVSNLDKDRKRETLVVAQAETPNLPVGDYYDNEKFLIGVQANFVPGKDTALVLQFAGTVTDGTITDYKDDGVTQKATIRQGIKGKTDAIVPSPCALRPYRTFLEVEQPESSFIFRMRSGSRGPECALFEADGGAWKHVAMDTIKEYLQARLKEAGVDMPVIA